MDDEEEERVRSVYERYRRDPRRARAWSAENPGNLLIREEVACAVLERAGDLGQGDILDVGCGSGWWLRSLTKAGVAPGHSTAWICWPRGWRQPRGPFRERHCGARTGGRCPGRTDGSGSSRSSWCCRPKALARCSSPLCARPAASWDPVVTSSCGSLAYRAPGTAQHGSSGEAHLPRPWAQI